MLGVDKKASADEIKKAYRKLARQYHPDRNPGDGKAEERFKEIQGAYDVLARPRQAQAVRPRHAFGGFGGRATPAGRAVRGRAASTPAGFWRHPLQPLRRWSRPARAARRPAAARPRAERGRDLEAEATISFDQSVDGAQIPLTVPTAHDVRDVPRHRREARDEPGRLPAAARAAGIESQGQGLFSISQPCSRCGGSRHDHRGPVPDLPRRRLDADAQEVPRQHPRGRPRRQSRVRLAGKGEPGRNGGPPGDLYVVTRVVASPVFTRKGDNLEVEVPLTIPEAIRGAEVEVPTLDGRKRLRVPAGTKHGTVQRLRGEGPPMLGGSADAGTSTTASSSTCPPRSPASSRRPSTSSRRS